MYRLLLKTVLELRTLKFSNLQEFTILDQLEKREQDFNKLREELAQQFSDQGSKKLEIGFFKDLGDNLSQGNFDFDQELRKIRIHNQKIEQQVNKHNAVISQQHSKVEPPEAIRGISKSINVSDSNKIIGNRREQDLSVKLVTEQQLMKNEPGKEVALELDRKCSMTEIQNLQLLEKEALFKEQQKGELKLELSKDHDRGFER